MRGFLMETVQIGNLDIRYSLLEERDETAGYGVLVELAGEQAAVPGITPSRSEAVALLGLLARGTVTPVTVMDIVEDWLLW